MRLNRYIARSLGIGRRAADELIEEGRVKLNGEPARLGAQVGKEDTVTVDDKEVLLQPFTYVLLDKPEGYVCSRKRQDEKPTIYDIIPGKYHHLQVAGRLDADSSGLLLLTNDGQFALQLTHPRYAKQKRYVVKLDKPLAREHKEQIEKGVRLDDGISKLRLLGSGRQWRVHMHEGRNRQIRRTFAALGYRVQELRRTHLGKYTLENIPEQGYIEVDKQQV